MTNNNTTKVKTMKSNLIALLKDKKMNFAKKVASNMEKGLNNELREICEIGRVLRDVEGLAKSQVNHWMNTDEDFIPDVLQFYNGGK